MRLSILDASVQLAGLFVLGVAGLVTLGIAWAVIRVERRRREVDTESWMNEPWFA